MEIDKFYNYFQRFFKRRIIQNEGYKINVKAINKFL